MLTLDDYCPITLEDKARFTKHYKNYAPPHSDYMFTTMISWRDYVHYHYTFKEKQLLLMTEFNNKTYFRPPIGKPSKKMIQEVITLAQTIDNPVSFGMIPENIKQYMENTFEEHIFFEHQEYFDYVYKTEDLVNLNGSKYSSIRNRLNKFKKNNTYSVEHITENNFQEVKEFLKRWCLWKDCESNELLAHERKAILYAIAHFYELNLQGILIYINDKIEAIAVFEHMDSKTLLVHFEKGSPDYDGVYKAINWETAKAYQDQYTYINRESDMGEPGLRRAKRSYRPHHYNKVYHIKKADLHKLLK